MTPETLVSPAWDVLKCIADPLKDQLRYVICSKSYTQDLREEVDKLQGRFNEFQNATETAKNNLGEVYENVTKWQENAEKALMEAPELLAKFENATKTCCYGTLPDLIHLYQFSTEAKDKIENIQRLLRIGSSIKVISCDSPVTGIKFGEKGVFESRASILLHIMDALGDDSKSVVGVCGMGGVGKTYLLDEVERKIRGGIIRGQSSFHWVARADLLGKQDIKGIQEAIASSLELKMTNKESVEMRAEFLRRRLVTDEENKKKVLIILDNLSEKLELESVGIPCEDGKVRGCKLLLTSRDRNVLMEMHCDENSVFHLPELKGEEAKILFESTVGKKDGHDVVEDGRDVVEPFVDIALHICAGLPFLIVEMANLFRKGSHSEWTCDLTPIEMSKNEGIGKKINERMRLSYDHLNGDVKSFLRLCVIYGVPMPKRENLVRYGMGYVLNSEYENMQRARYRLDKLIKTLEASSLSLDNGDADCFKIHDLFYKFVAYVALRDYHFLVLKDEDKSATQLLLKNKLNSCKAICFPDINVMKLPEKLDCPELLIFLLFSHNKSLEVLDSYFNSMGKLIVLNLTGIRLVRSSLPSPFQFLKNLHTLCLDDCLLEDVSILGELKRLQILSFANSKILQLPKEIGQLSELRLLDLNNCSELEIIEPDVLGRLTTLEELYMINSFDRWNVVELQPPQTNAIVELQPPQTNASLTELNNMTKLCTLHISITDPKVLPEDLNVVKLDKYNIQIGEVPHLPSHGASKTVMIRGDTVHWDAWIQLILNSTENLYLDGLNREVLTICTLFSKNLPNLQHLHIENSRSFRFILLQSFRTYFKMLKSLILKNLFYLENICKNCITSNSVGSLEEVRVEQCGKMKVLFPFPLARELPRLKQIRVVTCKSMEKIAEFDDCDKVEFCNLHVLELRDLSNIKNFFTVRAPSGSKSDDNIGTQVAFFCGQQVLIPSLKYLTMDGLPNLIDICSDEFPFGLSNLQSLEVARCKSLSKVINFGWLVRLHKLDTLIVAHCASVHEIFYLDGSSASGNVEIPSKITTLCLKDLPSLRHIWNKNPYEIVRFHYLKKLKVSSCDNLRFLFYPSMIKSLVQLRELSVRFCKKMEAIIMEEERLEMETQESLAFPMLTKLCFGYLESLTCFSHEKCLRQAQSQGPLRSRSPALFNRKVAFPRLETLKITGINNIEMIWDSQVVEDSFPILKSLCVNECSKLVNIGPSCILQWLSKLERLEAEACGSVEVVFKPQPLNSLDVNDVACFPLKQLQLIELPELKCVWDKEFFHQVELQYPHSVSVSKCASLNSLFPASITRDLMQLEEPEIDECGHVELNENTSHASHSLASKTLDVHGCSKTEILPLPPENEMPLHNRPSILKGISVKDKGGPSRQLSMLALSKNFTRMKTLEVSYCDGLSKMFTPAIAENLKRLTELRISYCKTLTEIISDEGGKEGHVVTFSQLKYMKLDGLIGLRCFSLGKCTLEFPHLKDMIVIGCLNMKFFSGGLIKAPKVERVQVSGGAPYGEENLNIPFQNMFKDMAMVAGVKFMRLSKFPELIGKWHGEIYPIKSSWKLESLVMDKCPSFITAIPSTLMCALNNMRRLQVRDCDSLEEIFDLKGLEVGESTLLLPELQHLDLINLQRLSRLWNKDLQGTLSFNSLGDLTLYNCGNLRHAFSPLMARCLTNLVRIDIKECVHIEGVIADEVGQGSVVEKITFPKLSLMKLECLPKLTSFLSGKNYMLDCPILEHLIIAHCPKMRSLQSLIEIDQGTSSLFTPQVQFRRLESMVISHMDSLSKIWTNELQETFSFTYLQKVDAQNCKSLENLFPHWVATSLSRLKELRVESCVLEEIVVRGDDTPHSSTTQNLFPNLSSLVLHDMPHLKSFCPNYLNWSSLNELRVTHCDKLNISNFAAFKNKSAQRDDHQNLLDETTHSSLERDFPSKLLLVDKDIQMIHKGKLLHDFGEPKALILACFHDQGAVFPSRILLERFQNLQSLEVSCSSFEDIFPEEGPFDKGKHSVLENLRELKLSKLHNLKCVWKEDRLVLKMLQSIKKFEVWDCPSLTTLFPVVTSFQNLTELVVKNSSGLVHLATVSMVTNLVHLINMTIIGCERMKEVVANDGKGEGKVISLGKLEKLTLQNLPNLVCFSSTVNFIFRFPSLLSIEVEECPKMRIFSERMLSTPNLKDVSVFRDKWEGNWEGDLNTTMQMLSA